MSTSMANRHAKLQKIVDEQYHYRNYYDDRIEVREVGSDNSGVFAVRQFIPGELIIEVRGQVFSKKANYAGSNYAMTLSKGRTLEPYTPGALVNHSCNPNAELLQLTKRSMGIVAICNIEEGIEIAIDYKWKAASWIPRCFCGSENCRGWVVAEGEDKKMRKLSR